MKILIFGGGGFIGSAIIDRLLIDGHDIRVFERPRIEPYRRFSETEKLDWLTGDMLSTHDISNAMSDREVIIHLVSSTLPKNSNEDPIYDVQSNLIGTLQILNFMVTLNIKKIIFISSGGTVYGLPKYLPIDEQHPCEPQVSYGITKLAIENYLNLYRTLHNVKPIILRVANPFGKRQRVETAQGAIGVFLNKALNKQPIEIWGDGTVTRDYVFIDDVAEAFAKALDYNGEKVIFNISSGIGTSLNQVIEHIESVLGCLIERKYLEARNCDVPVSILDNKLAQNEMGWNPKTDLKEGIKKTAEWIKKLIYKKTANRDCFLKVNISSNKADVKKVQQQLLPLHPLLKLIERLLILLPRSFQYINLIPSDNIQVLDIESGNFIAEETPPKFDIQFSSPQVESGWYYLEASVVRHSADRKAKVLLIKSNHFNQNEVIQIPSNFRGSIREVIFIPNGVNALIWQPSEVAGRFSQSPLILHRITWLESYYRRLWRVLSDLWVRRNLSRYENNDISYIKAFYCLKEAYKWSVSLRFEKSFGISYDTFVKNNDTLSKYDQYALEKHIPILQHKPLFSIIMPVFNPKSQFFREAINSIIAQSYTNWELCIADDASTDLETKVLINECLLKDSRIKVIFRNQNGHISAASNSALSIANGDFIVLIDQDDKIPSHALYHFVVDINRHPDACIIYSDEDKIDIYGNRYDPYFKSDWNQDLFYSQNMISHLGVYKTSLVRDVGGFRVGYEGAQDYDLALRCLQKISSEQIFHIPRILYHWRAHQGSSAYSSNAKPYAIEAGYKALQDHFGQTNDVKVILNKKNKSYRVIYPLPQNLPLVTLIIATRDKFNILKKCIESIKNKTNYENFEVFIVDNQSKDKDTLTYLNSLTNDKRFRILKYNAPFNYSAINNYAVSLANGQIIGLINNDIEVINEDWLSEMVRHALRPEIGAVGAKLLYSDNTVQHAGVILGIGGIAGHSHKYYKNTDSGYFCRAELQQQFSAVTGACLVVKKSTYIQAGGLDAENLTIALNDVDFCLKLQKMGLKNIFTPYALLYHHESISRGHEDNPEKQKRFMKETDFMKDKWGEVLTRDRFYNPNLTANKENFSLKLEKVSSEHHGYPLKIS